MRKVTILTGKNVEVLPKIDDRSVGCVVTSPPYKTKDGYSEKEMVDLHKIIGSKMAPGGWYFLNFGQLSEDFSRPFRLHSALSDCAKESGLVPWQNFTWVKSIVIDGFQRGHFQPISSPSICNYCVEFVFSFYRPMDDGSRPALSKLAVGVPYADESNLKRGTRGKDGNVHCAGDAWFIPYETTGASKKKGHEYEFPNALAERCIKLAGLRPGSTVLDPFAGSGVVGRVAASLGFNAILVEKNLHKAAELERKFR